MNTRIKQTKEAINNLRGAIAELIKDGASAADIEPYKVNLREQEARLIKLEKSNATP